MASNNQNNELRCQLCKTSHTSEWEHKEHMWSLLHHVKLEQKEKNTSHECVLCQTSTGNLVDYGRHLNEQKHKQVLEKAKEKKKAKPKPSSSRHVLQKIGKQKQKKALLPNPHWHLNSSYNPVFQFGNWKPRDDFHWKKHSNHPEMQGLNPQPFNNNQYWNNYNDNNNSVYRFNANNKNPHERWNKPSNMLNGNTVELNPPNPNNMGKKFIVTPNNQKLKKGPPLGTKKSKSSTDFDGYSEGQQKPLETSSKTADNSKSAGAKTNSAKISKKLSQAGLTPTKPKVNTSPVSKIKTNISKLKTKGSIVKEKQSHKLLFVIDKDGAGNVIEKGSGEMLEDNPSRKKFIVATSAKKSDNVPTTSVNKNIPPSPKKRPQVMLKNGKPTEKHQISAENKTEPCKSPAKKNSSVNPSDSNTKISGDANSKEDTSVSLKRSFNSNDTPNSASISNPSKKRRSDPSEQKKTTAEADTTNPGLKQMTLVQTNSSNPNDCSEKDKTPSISSDLNPTKILPSTQNENGFKVNKELVTKLHKNLVGQSPMKLPNSNVKSRSSGQDNVAHSKDEASPAGKQPPVTVQREELVKMMKLPRLSRKEKMHLSSLLQSYTKSQNKKLAVPRLTMQLSGLYDSISQDTADVGEMSDLELPAGMEEEIAHLIKREKLDELPGDGIIDDQNLGLSPPLSNIGLQRVKKKTIPNSVNKKKSVRNQTVSEKSQAGQSSPQGLSNVKIERTDDQHLSDVSSPAVCRELTNNSRRESNMQSDNNSLFSSTLSDPPVTSSQSNLSAPVTTGTRSDSSENIPATSQTNSSNPVTTGTQFSENMPASSQINSSNPVTTGTTATWSDSSNGSKTENVFNKVYLLTLREEQIRSSIVDMNEKMNYLRKLIEDSQMALQGCCIEHKRLTEEEVKIRDQRLKILQDAMTGKSGNADSMNPSLLHQIPTPQSLQTPAPPSLQLAIPNPQSEQTFSQIDLCQHQSSIIGHQAQPQPSGTVTQNQFSNPTAQPNFSAVSGVISPVNGRCNQTQESLSPSHSSDLSPNLLTSQPQIQSSVPPDPLPSDQHSPSPAVCRQNQNNRLSSPLNPVDTISFGSDATSTNNGFSEKRNTATNIGANVTPRRGSPLGFEHITIKQEPPSPPPPQANIETILSSPQGVVDNTTCNHSAPPTTTVSEVQRLPDNNITDTLSGNASKQGLSSAADRENETMTFETVHIKKEPVTPPPQPQNETEEQFDRSKEKQVESSHSLHIMSQDKEKGHSSDRQTDDVTPNKPLELSRHNQLNNSAAEQGPLSTTSQTPEVEPVINFESVKIKKEPLTPPPDPQVEGEETLFVPRLPSADSNGEDLAPFVQNETKSLMEIDKTAENICSPPSSRNLSGSGSQTETPGKSSGMSMTYLGKMPNNFLEQLALSWRKQNMSAMTNESSGVSPEYSFSDGESTSSRTVCNFISKTSPQFSVPARLNPRVCLEPLNMKFHRKRTLSEPVSNCDSSSLSTRDVQQEGSQGKKDGPEKSSSVKKSSGKEGSNCDNQTDFVIMEEGPKVRRKSLRRRSRDRKSGFKENKSESLMGPSVQKNEDSSHSDVMDPFPNHEEDIVLLDLSDVDSLKESKLCSRLPEGSPYTSGSDIIQNNPVGSLNEPSAASPNVAQTEINFDPKSPTNPLNIWNNLSSLHVVRTKKFPRTHVNGSQLLTFRGAKNPVNGLYVFENHLYASYQGNSPCKFSLSNGECLQIYNCKPYNVQCMLVCRIATNKTRLFSGGASEVLLVFDEVTGKLCSQIDTNQKIYSFHENWGSLFVGLANGGVTKINLKSLKKNSELSYGSKPINCLATCTEGAQKLLCVGAYDASILIVDAMTGLLLKTLNCYHRLLYSIKVLHNLIFSCSSDKTLQVHDVTSGKLLRCLQDHSSTISCLHVEDNLLVTGSHDKRLNIYNSSHPRDSPVIFYTTNKESISCLAVHNKAVYCGDFFGHIETVQFDTDQKWVCKYDCCELVFGQRQGLFYHLVNQHLQMTGMDKKKCLWENCGEYIYSVLDITEHCENHINHIVQSE